ncbi:MULTISPECIES: JAB domain-containing protein [unclassified Sphingobium]|uniref:JAB domain-containing protein n=1 Tax=unclassified Sphingobium TaxID=2611147 RepID=UPI0035A59FF7
MAVLTLAEAPQPAAASTSAWFASIACMYSGLTHERIHFMFHNAAGRHVGAVSFEGDVGSASFDTLTVLRTAIVREAASILVAHNHPSGKALPSLGDCEATRNLAVACRAVGLRLSDHLIVAENNVFSFRGNGLM